MTSVESACSIGMIAETFDLDAGVDNLKLIIGANMDVNWRHW
ncbi:MAG: hypothetical protein P8N51_07230 [Pseudomonadales bacterium]|nr:hypothetical protein [Pseudomonadales bacterium]